MSDLFQDGVPFEYVDRAFAVMAQTVRHTYQILTKRPERMLAYSRGMAALEPWERSFRLAKAMYQDHPAGGWVNKIKPEDCGGMPWPLRNVWLGVSAENQEYADKRIPLLLQTPAAKRFVSYEPALGPVDFTVPIVKLALSRCTCPWPADAVQTRHLLTCPADPRPHEPLPKLDWIIVGGESGPGARPFDISWARAVVRQCRAAGVACFVKQLGSHAQEYLTPQQSLSDEPTGKLWKLILGSRKGGDMEEWPEELRVREFPENGR